MVTQIPETLALTLSNYWEIIAQNTGLPLSQIAEQALVAPARCRLKDTGQVSAGTEVLKNRQVSNIEERLVEKAFAFLPELSQILRDKYGL